MLDTKNYIVTSLLLVLSLPFLFLIDICIPSHSTLSFRRFFIRFRNLPRQQFSEDSFLSAQITVAGPGVILLVHILMNHEHRLQHPCRWPNPSFLGLFITGLSFTASCYIFKVAPGKVCVASIA